MPTGSEDDLQRLVMNPARDAHLAATPVYEHKADYVRGAIDVDELERRVELSLAHNEDQDPDPPRLTDEPGAIFRLDNVNAVLKDVYTRGQRTDIAYAQHVQRLQQIRAAEGAAAESARLWQFMPGTAKQRP